MNTSRDPFLSRLLWVTVTAAALLLLRQAFPSIERTISGVDATPRVVTRAAMLRRTLWNNLIARCRPFVTQLPALETHVRRYPTGFPILARIGMNGFERRQLQTLREESNNDFMNKILC